MRRQQPPQSNDAVASWLTSTSDSRAFPGPASRLAGPATLDACTRLGEGLNLASERFASSTGPNVPLRKPRFLNDEGNGPCTQIARPPQLLPAGQEIPSVHVRLLSRPGVDPDCASASRIRL